MYLSALAEILFLLTHLGSLGIRPSGKEKEQLSSPTTSTKEVPEVSSARNKRCVGRRRGSVRARLRLALCSTMVLSQVPCILRFWRAPTSDVHVPLPRFLRPDPQLLRRPRRRLTRASPTAWLGRALILHTPTDDPAYTVLIRLCLLR